MTVQDLKSEHKFRPEVIRDQNEYDCDNGDFIYIECKDGHWTKRLLRCRLYSSCDGCRGYRIRSFLAKAYDRFSNCQRPKFINLWTYGTSLDANSANSLRVVSWFQKFNKQMRMASKREGFRYDPQLWVLEQGSEGGKLHIHCISWGFSPHEKHKERWRKITGEKSNVNYSVQKHSNPKKAFAYCAKYIAKEGSRYYWMGEMLTQTNSEIVSWKCWCGKPFQRIVFEFSIPIGQMPVYYHQIDNFEYSN